MAAGEFDKATRAAIFKRASGRCERCGLKCTGPVHFHHRRPRRLGGSRDEKTGLASNGLLLHPSCHDSLESMRAAALVLGLILHAHDDPETVPVRLWNGWFTLVGSETVPLQLPESGRERGGPSSVTDDEALVLRFVGGGP